MVNQKDIAKRLNMTQQAVSAALRDSSAAEGTSKVSEETRELVLRTAKEMGYYSNRYAAILKAGKTRLIGVIHGRVTPDWLEKIRVLCSAIEKSGHVPWTLDYTHFQRGHISAMEQMLTSKVQGVIFASVAPNRIDHSPLEKARIPLVSYEGGLIPGIHLINPDKEEGFTSLIEHLYQQGCRKMTVCWGITKEMVDLNARATAASAVRALERFNREHGISYHSPITFLPEWPAPDDEYVIGYQLGIEALKSKPDALIFPNDTRAIGGMRACAEAGLKIPRDICVTGFNNEKQSAFAMSPLTTVAQPIETMAQQTVASIIRLIECGGEPEEQESLYPCTLVLRQSSLFGKNPC